MKKHEKDSWENRDDIRTESAKRRNDAMVNLEIAKTIERTKSLKGFVWVKKDKMSKQISPDKLDHHLTEGWKISK